MRTKAIDSEIEKKILQAAVKIFYRKGIHGARMQEIADEAEVSKSMLHYYFINKEELFNKVFEMTLKNIFPKINAILVSELPLFQKIAVFMNSYTDILFEHYASAGFIMTELNTNEDKVLDMMITAAGFDLSVFNQQLEEAWKQGSIEKTDPRILLLNMISLCVFPFVAMPVHLKRFKLNLEQYFQLLEKRKAIITNIIINSIKKENALVT